MVKLKQQLQHIENYLLFKISAPGSFLITVLKFRKCQLP